MKDEKYYNFIRKSSFNAEVYIYGYIVDENYRENSDTSAISFKKELDALGDLKHIDLHINSGGGDVFQALAIYNMLERHPAQITAYIDGLAASAASVIAMAASKIIMPENSFLMIHNAWMMSGGDHRTLRKDADTLEQLTANLRTAYLSRDLNISETELIRMMDEETWLDCKTAIGLGLADEIARPVNAAASVDKSILNQYKNVPANLEAKLSAVTDSTKNNSELSPLVKVLMKL